MHQVVIQITFVTVRNMVVVAHHWPDSHLGMIEKLGGNWEIRILLQQDIKREALRKTFVFRCIFAAPKALLPVRALGG